MAHTLRKLCALRIASHCICSILALTGLVKICASVELELTSCVCLGLAWPGLSNVCLFALCCCSDEDNKLQSQPQSATRNWAGQTDWVALLLQLLWLTCDGGTLPTFSRQTHTHLHAHTHTHTLARSRVCYTHLLGAL